MSFHSIFPFRILYQIVFAFYSIPSYLADVCFFILADHLLICLPLSSAFEFTHAGLRLVLKIVFIVWVHRVGEKI